MATGIPKISAPLAKDIRTGEGIFEWASAAVLSIAAILPHGLSWTQSGTFITVLAGIKAARRGVIKLGAIQKDAGIDAPIEVGHGNVLDGPLAKADEVIKEIEGVAAIADKIASQPGTPAESLGASAGAPGDKPPAAPAEVPQAPVNTGA